MPALRVDIYHRARERARLALFVPVQRYRVDGTAVSELFPAIFNASNPIC